MRVLGNPPLKRHFVQSEADVAKMRSMDRREDLVRQRMKQAVKL